MWEDAPKGRRMRQAEEMERSLTKLSLMKNTGKKR